MQPKVSCICPTRGRFETLRQAVSFFLLQDYPNKELIIFNNHPHPINPHPKLIKQGVKVINGGDYSGKSMENVYADALKHVSEDSELISIWDDDDMYFPWHLSSNIEKLLSSNKQAIRSSYGYWQDINNSMKDDYIVIRNTLEASMISRKEFIFFPEDNLDSKSPGWTHPHTAWVVKVTSSNGYLYNDEEITANYRWGYGKTYHHLQSAGPHKNSQELGEKQLLRPCAVRHLFYDLLEKTYLTIQNKKIVPFTKELKSKFFDRLVSYDLEKFEHIDKYNVWLYWNSLDIPGFIKLCHNSIINNTYASVKLLNDDVLKTYHLPEYFWELQPVQKSDYIRIFLLNSFGGWWFDSDTYVVGDLDEYYFRHLINHENVFPWEYDVPGNMTTPIFSSKPYGVIIKYAFQYINDYLKSKPQVGWAGIGVNGILKSVSHFKDRGEGYYFGLPNIAKFGYNNHQISNWDFKNIKSSELQMIIFHWSQIGAEVSHKIGLSSQDDLELVKEKITAVYPNLKDLFINN